jgi:hypothetical protein
MTLSRDDVRLLKWVGGAAALTGDDACVPVIRRLVKKQDAPGALTEQHARVFTLLTNSDECRDLIFRYLNLVRIRAGKTPLDENGDPAVVEQFLKAVKVLQQSTNSGDALVQSSNLYAFLQGESPAIAEEAFDRLLTQDPATALTLFRTRGTAPADKMSLIKQAASGNRMAILRLADTSVVPEAVSPDLAVIQQREADVARKEKILDAKIQKISGRLGMDPAALLSEVGSHSPTEDTEPEQPTGTDQEPHIETGQPAVPTGAYALPPRDAEGSEEAAGRAQFFRTPDAHVGEGLPEDADVKPDHEE